MPACSCSEDCVVCRKVSCMTREGLRGSETFPQVISCTAHPAPLNGKCVLHLWLVRWPHPSFWGPPSPRIKWLVFISSFWVFQFNFINSKINFRILWTFARQTSPLTLFKERHSWKALNMESIEVIVFGETQAQLLGVVFSGIFVCLFLVFWYLAFFISHVSPLCARE